MIDTATGGTEEWVRIEGVMRELFHVTVLHRVFNPAAISIMGDEINRMVSIDNAPQKSGARLHA